MTTKYSDSKWEYDIELFEMTPITYQTSFDGLPLPNNDVYKLLGITEVEKIDKIIKEIILWREVLFGKKSEEVLFAETLIYFKHKIHTNVELVCAGGTDLSLNRDCLEKEYCNFPDRFDSLENYTIAFSGKARDVIEKGQSTNFFRYFK